ncbi:MAG: Cobalt transport protein [Ilumatobacteraceae bacterium]|nr:Cobalt transport protein [Ilumatobacteraceae bacterium]
MTWLVWAIAAAACVQIAPNPLYVAVVLAISFLVVSAHRLDTTLARAFPILVGLGVVFALLRVALTALTTHSPAIDGTPEHLWFTLPQATLPQILGGFTVGGTIEGDIVLFAAAQAFAVVGILGAFGVFNAVASHHELVQAAPRAFHEPGLILTVALAFVPSTMRAVTDVREADRARTGGRVVRRGRLVRLTVPILESGLERAVALAESMDARGFARQPRGRGDRASAWLGLVAMLALGAAFIALIGRASEAAVVAGVIGVVTLLAAVVLASRSSGTSRYRPRRLTRLDIAVGAGVLLAPLGLTLVAAVWDQTLYWTAYPLRFPPFSLAPVVCLVALAIPVLVPPLPVADGRPREAALAARSELAGAS